MASLLLFDEANVLEDERLPYTARAAPLEEYFSHLPDERRTEREKISKALSDKVLGILSLAYVYAKYGMITPGWLESKLYDAYIEGLVEVNVRIDDYIETRARKFAELVSTNTEEHLPYQTRDQNDTSESSGRGKMPDEWYTSPDRADYIGEEEADLIGEYTDFVDAKEAGMNDKTWNTMKDNKVREKHVHTEGQTVPIDDYFLVGDEYAMFPRDFEHLSDDNVCGCRCWLTYS